MDAKLAKRIELRKQNKIESPFGRGNFAEGTVAVFESPTLKFLANEEDRKWPHQRYETFTAEVVSIQANGPDSFVAVLDRPSNLIQGSNDTINIAWCREIVKYGEGKTTIRSHDLRTDFWHQDVLVTLPGKSPSKYQMHSVRAFLIFVLSRHPRYSGDNGDHIYDIEKLVQLVGGHFHRDDRWTLSISKKKFHAVFKKAMAKCRTSRRKAQHEESESMALMYEEDAMRELDYMME